MPKFGQLVRRHLNFLQALRRTRSPRKIQQLLSKARRQELLALVEIALNIVSPRSTLKLKERHKRPLYPHAALIRRISRARSEKAARVALQKGGALNLLPALLAPVLVEVAKSLLFNK